MTALWLVRHGPTHARAMVGWTDLPADLSDSAALSRLSAYLPDAPIVSSDLTRAIDTANAIANGRPRLPHLPGLRELHFGTWEMRSFAQIEAEAPDHIRAFWETPGDVAPPGGESWHQAQARVDGAIDGLLSLGHADLIVVAHFGAIVTQIQRALGLSASAAFGHRIDNLSVTRIATGAKWQADPINHMP